VTRVIGLTGGIGSGKSTAADMLGRLGGAVIDADDLSRALTAPHGGALEAIRAAFGAAMAPPGQGLDRRAMRERIFRDDEARRRLEAILHPAIAAEIDRRLPEARGAYVLLVVPLLFETGRYRQRVDRVVVVDCSEALQVARAAARSSLNPHEVRAIMSAQWPRWRRLQAADHVLWNGAGLASLEAQCRQLHETLAGG